MTDPDMPNSPMSALAQGAAASHEMFRAYVEAGFTEPQALEITIAMLVAMMRGGGQ